MVLKIKSYLYYLIAIIFGKVKFKDKFGVSYYLWKNTRLRQAIITGYRTDDKGVIYCIQTIADFIKPQKNKFICLDVGAFIGVISLHISRAFEGHCSLYSFEANELNFQRLKQNTQSQKNIIIIPYAVSNEKKVYSLVLTDDPGQHHLVKNTLNKNDVVQEVKAITINDFCQEKNIEIIDFMKIDAEQYDYEVLLGMEGLLKQNKVYFIIFEYDIKCQTLLEKYDYQILFIDRNQKYLSKNKKDNTLNAVAISSNINIKDVFQNIND